MTRVLALVAIGLPSVACFAGAAAVAWRGNAGWGWLILVGFLVCPLMNESASERLIRAASAGEAFGQDPQGLDAEHEHATREAGDAQ